MPGFTVTPPSGPIDPKVVEQATAAVRESRHQSGLRTDDLESDKAYWRKYNDGKLASEAFAEALRSAGKAPSGQNLGDIAAIVDGAAPGKKTLVVDNPYATVKIAGGMLFVADDAEQHAYPLAGVTNLALQLSHCRLTFPKNGMVDIDLKEAKRGDTLPGLTIDLQQGSARFLVSEFTRNLSVVSQVNDKTDLVGSPEAIGTLSLIRTEAGEVKISNPETHFSVAMRGTDSALQVHAREMAPTGQIINDCIDLPNLQRYDDKTLAEQTQFMHQAAEGVKARAAKAAAEFARHFDMGRG